MTGNNPTHRGSAHEITAAQIAERVVARMACEEEMLGALVAVTDELDTAHGDPGDFTPEEVAALDRPGGHAAIEAARAIGIAQPSEKEGATSTDRAENEAVERLLDRLAEAVRRFLDAPPGGATRAVTRLLRQTIGEAERARPSGWELPPEGDGT